MAKIILDSDSTITDLASAWLPLYNQRHNDTVTLDHFRSWEFHRYCKAGPAIYDILRTPGLFRNLKPLPHAVSVIRTLSLVHDVEIETALSSEAEREEKLDWYAEHLPFLPQDKIFFVHVGEDKRRNGDVLFDDSPYSISKFAGITVALEYPYNRYASPTRFVHDWIEFREYIDFLFPHSLKLSF